MPLIKSFNPSTDVDIATDTINIPTHGFGTIDGVIYRNGNGSSIGGLVHNTKYYVIVVDVDNIKLATNEINARSSTAVDLLTTGSGTTHSLEFTTIFPKETAVHNIYQSVRLTGGALTNPDGEIITAETVSDTLNIIGGAGVSFTNVNKDTKSFTLNATQYDFEVPVGTTNLRLFSDSGDDQSIILTPARGIAITRIGSQEVEFESFGVTETDTLQSISERGNITNNKLIMDNLLVAKIESTPGIDGVQNYTTTGTTGTAIALTGNGTLDNELLFSPDYATSTEAAKDVYVNFQSPAAQGTLSYTAVYTSESTLTTGSVILQRNDGGGWVTIDNVSGTTVDQSYEINGNYAEVDPATIDYRILFSWTGSSDIVTYRIRVTYEVENVPGTEIILTDTDTEVLTLGTLGGTVNIRGAINLADEINTDQMTIFNNNIVALNSDTDINLEPAGVGAVQIRSNWLSTNQSYINVFTDSQVDEVYIGSTTSLTTINDNLRIVDDVEIQGGNLTTNQSTFNLLVDTNLTTLNIGNANTDINLGNIDINGNTIDTNDSTGITITPAVTFSTDVNVENDLRVTQDFFVAKNSFLTGNLKVDQNLVVVGDVEIQGGDLTTNQTTFNLLNQPNSITAFSNANAVSIGSATGTTTIQHNLITIDDVDIQGGNLTTTQTTFNLLNANATTVNAFGDATTINFGSLIYTGNTITTDDSSGITFTPAVTFESDISVGNDINVPTLIVTSGITSPKATITDLTTSSITNNGSFGTDSLGVSNNATISNNLTVGNDLAVGGNTVITGNLTVQGTQTILNTSTLDVEDLNITLAKGAADATAANGAGLTIDGANATLTYNSVDDRLVFNKDLTINDAYITNAHFPDNGKATFGGIESGSFYSMEMYNNGTSNYIVTYNGTVNISRSGGGPATLKFSRPSGAGGTGIELDSNTTGGYQTIDAIQTAIPFELKYGGNTKLKINDVGVDTTSGWLTTAGVTEDVDTKTGATGTVAHDLDVATVFYHTTPAADFTANFTNTPTTNDRAISIAITVIQGATAYIPNAVEIDGTAQTVNWSGGITPVGNPNNVDIITFTLFRTSSSWTVIGALSTYG